MHDLLCMSCTQHQEDPQGGRQSRAVSREKKYLKNNGEVGRPKNPTLIHPAYTK